MCRELREYCNPIRHMTRKDDNEWVKKYMDHEVKDVRTRK